MKVLPYSRKTVAKGLKVWVSNHYRPTLFGIRGHYESSYKSGQYVETGTPGTGFFVRSGSSHAYKNFCAAQRAKLVSNYWDMLRGKEFSYEEEIARATKASHDAKDPNKKRILESYLNVLPLAKEAEEYERIIDAIKDMGHRHHKLTSYQSHVVSNLKSRIARLGHDVRDIQLVYPNECGEERYNQFAQVVINFSQVATSHRIWHASEHFDGLDANFDQVYFDLGIFNFVQAPLMTPVMRDTDGNTYYLYPEYLIRARSATDFDTFDIKSLTYLYREVPYDMISNMVLNSYADTDDVASTATSHHRRDYEQYGSGLLVSKDTVAINDMESESKARERVVGELYIPELKLRYYVRDVKALKHFVHALNEYKEL